MAKMESSKGFETASKQHQVDVRVESKAGNECRAFIVELPKTKERRWISNEEEI